MWILKQPCEVSASLSFGLLRCFLLRTGHTIRIDGQAVNGKMLVNNNMLQSVDTVGVMRARLLV
jgi:hypothetical protein